MAETNVGDLLAGLAKLIADDPTVIARPVVIDTGDFTDSWSGSFELEDGKLYITA